MTQPYYNALLLDTSIYINNELRLEEGLLATLQQFQNSPITLLLPDVIKNELLQQLKSDTIKAHKAFFDKLNDVRKAHIIDATLLNKLQAASRPENIETVVQDRIQKFIDNTGAVVLKSDDFVSTQALLDRYFTHKPPFKKNGKKKYEFPDAIALMAAEAWAKKHNQRVLAASTDQDWVDYCNQSDAISCIQDLGTALAKILDDKNINAFIDKLKMDLWQGKLKQFLTVTKIKELDQFFKEDILKSISIPYDSVYNVKVIIDTRRARARFDPLKLINNQTRVIAISTDHVKVETKAEIIVFSNINIHNKNQYIRIQHTLTMKVIITIQGTLKTPIESLKITQVEFVCSTEKVNLGNIDHYIDDNL